jgi:dipeptidyl aminopeptidase/acylaminoacyl peptidase
MTRRSITRAFGIAGALVACGCVFLAVRSASWMLASCAPSHGPIPTADRVDARARFPALEEVSFRTSDGLTLRGWYVPPAPASAAAVILVHGGGESRTQMHLEMRALVERGFGVLAYDSRASGESDGDVCTKGDREQRDVTAALDFVSARPEVDPHRIGLVGFSIGASAVAMVAARDPRASAVLLNATWTTLTDEIRFKYGKYGALTALPALWAARHAGIDLDAVRPVDHIGALAPRPLLIVTGAVDTDTPVPVMERLLAAAGEPKAMWVMPGVGHGGYAAADPGAYLPRLTGFVEGALLRNVTR